MLQPDLPGAIAYRRRLSASPPNRIASPDVQGLRRASSG